jgi:hypothetical protein
VSLHHTEIRHVLDYSHEYTRMFDTYRFVHVVSKVPFAFSHNGYSNSQPCKQMSVSAQLAGEMIIGLSTSLFPSGNTQVQAQETAMLSA